MITDPNERPGIAIERRLKAEEIVQGEVAPALVNRRAQTPEETRRMVHELRVHQIELEMQNEELRRAQFALDAVRARYFDLYDLAPVGYCTLSEQGLILEANLTAGTLLGVTRGLLVSQPISQFIHKEDQDSYYLHRQRLLQTLEPQAWELRMVKKDGTVFWAQLEATAVQDADGASLGDSQGLPVSRFVLSDITARKRAEAYKEMGLSILRLLNEPGAPQASIRSVVAEMKTQTGFDAVGIRLQNGDDYPYIAQEGFSKDFLMTENTLIERALDGGLCRDKDGNFSLECNCGLVIASKAGLANPLFTLGGSAWTSDSTALMNLPPSADLRLHPRNRCIQKGYASIALVPIRDKDRVVGLIQLNDQRKGCFTQELVELLEGIAAQIGATLMRKQAEADLLQLNEELETRIQARTAELRAALDGVNLEIQVRRKAEEAVQRSEEKYITVVENSPTGIFILRDQKILYANPRFFEIVRRSPDQLAAIRPWEILHPEDRPLLREIWQQCLAEPSLPQDCECRILTQAGVVRWISGRSAVIPFRDRPAILVNIQDTTERHEAVQALQDAQEALHGLSARMISIQENERFRVARELHDSIGSALSAIKFMVEGSLEAAVQGSGDGRLTGLRAVIPVIQNSVEEVRRIAMALRPLTLDDLGLIVTIEWFLREFQTAHPGMKVERRIGLTEESIPDPLKIDIFRILQEGTTNSAKYSLASRMRVSLWREEDQLVLEMEDDGVGFDPAALGHPDATGGFGLASMRERAKWSGGELSILTARGKGTRIRARWPLA